jgi:hypothetical protein
MATGSPGVLVVKMATLRPDDGVRCSGFASAA